MNREKIKELVIKYVFNGENTTDFHDLENTYLGLYNMFDSEEYFYKHTGIGASVVGLDEKDIVLTVYSEKIGGKDILVEFINNYSIEGLVDGIEKAIEFQASL